MAPPRPADDRWLERRGVIVTAGGTREPIDAVRYLANRSSGKMGNALARAAAHAGAAVTLVTTVDPPSDVALSEVVRVESADSMAAAVRGALPGSSVLLMAAAVADYRPVHVSTGKVKKSGATWMLELEPTVDILASLRGTPERDGVYVVGFAAETADLLRNAETKLREKGLDLIVLNDVSRGDIAMGADSNEVTIIDRDGVVEVVRRAPKDEVAGAILRVVRARIA
ncbi:MAG TPA: phosphopantothenoylcysteine decarboxylase [Candidatus Dormibacteraeota bacterium]